MVRVVATHGAHRVVHRRGSSSGGTQTRGIHQRNVSIASSAFGSEGPSSNILFESVDPRAHLSIAEISNQINMFTLYVLHEDSKTRPFGKNAQLRKAMVYRMIADQLRYDDFDDVADALESQIGLKLMSPKPSCRSPLRPLVESMLLKGCIREIKKKKLSRRTSSFLDSAAGISDGYGNEPPLMPPSTIPDRVRSEIAAVNMLRAMKYQAPIYLNASQRWIFFTLNSTWFNTVWTFLGITHLIIAFWETPPQLRGDYTHEELSRMGYPQSFHAVDFACCTFYFVITVLSIQMYGGVRSFFSRADFQEKGMALVTGLLWIDAMVGASESYPRVFRFLRPGMLILRNEAMTRAVKGAGLTVIPLSKLFLLLFVGMVFYAIVGLNLFSGYPDHPEADMENTFGAACLLHTQQNHPFANFGEAILSMYILMTSDNNPSIMWPFYTCQCTYTPHICPNVTDGSFDGIGPYTWDAGEKCTARNVMALIFFVSYLCIAFFILGNCVLAICFVHFEESAVSLLMKCALMRRISLIHAFYMLEDDGFVYYDVFINVMDQLKQIKNLEQSIPYYFNALDQNGDGKLDLNEFFDIIEMTSTKIYSGRSKNPYPRYNNWKESRIHYIMQRVVDAELYGMPVSDYIVNALIVFNAVLASVESTRFATQSVFAEIITYLFVAETLLKFLVHGPRTYFADAWNKLDFEITLLNVVGLVCEKLVKAEYIPEKYQVIFTLFGILRLVRLIKALTYIGGREHGFYANILRAVASAVPATSNILVLICFFSFSFACLGLELLGGNDIRSRNIALTSGYFNYFTDELENDWGSLLSSLYSIIQLLVGNTWSDLLLNNTYDERILATYFLFLHFIGVFVLLNIVQSVFVYAFDILLDDAKYQGTWEADLSALDNKIAESLNPKALRRNKHIDRLMLAKESFSTHFKIYLGQCKSPQIVDMLRRIDKNYYEDEFGEEDIDAFSMLSARSHMSTRNADDKSTSIKKELNFLREKLKQKDIELREARGLDSDNGMHKTIKTETRSMLKEIAATREDMNAFKRVAQEEISNAKQILKADLDHLSKVLGNVTTKDKSELSDLYAREVEHRMQLLDEIHQLKGNMRVVARIRSVDTPEEAALESVTVLDTKNIKVQYSNAAESATHHEFDEVIDPKADNQDIMDSLKSLVQSVIDGYNVCIMIYGDQDGKKDEMLFGKLTLTDNGNVRLSKQSPEEGILFRIIRYLFHEIVEERRSTHSWEMDLSMTGIKNEKLTDLLLDDAGVARVKPLSIIQIPGQGCVVDGANVMRVSNLREAMQSVHGGRMRAKLVMGDDPSTHTIVTQLLSRVTNDHTKRVYIGKLSVVLCADANVESKSNNQQKRTIRALGDVVTALANKHDKPPYSKSNLTKLLKDSIGGNAKTTLLVSLSPSPDNMGKLKNILDFAKDARAVEAEGIKPVVRTASLVAAHKKVTDAKRKVLRRMGSKTKIDMGPMNEQRVREPEPTVEERGDEDDEGVVLPVKSRGEAKAEAKKRRMERKKRRNESSWD